MSGGFGYRSARSRGFGAVMALGTGAAGIAGIGYAVRAFIDAHYLSGGALLVAGIVGVLAGLVLGVLAAV